MLFNSLRNYLSKTVIYYKVREAMISLNFFYAHVDRKEVKKYYYTFILKMESTF